MATHSLLSKPSSIYSADLEHTNYERPNSPTPYRSRGFRNWRSQLQNSEDDSVASTEYETQFIWLPPPSAYSQYRDNPFTNGGEYGIETYLSTQTLSTPRQSNFSNSSQIEGDESEPHEMDPVEEIISLYSYNPNTSTSRNTSPYSHSDTLFFASSDSNVSTQVQDALRQRQFPNSSQIKQDNFEPHELDPVEEIISLYSESPDTDTSHDTPPISHSGALMSALWDSRSSLQFNSDEKPKAAIPLSSSSEDVPTPDPGYNSHSPIVDRMDEAGPRNKRFSFEPQLPESAAFDVDNASKSSSFTYVDTPRTEALLGVNFDADCKSRRSSTSTGFRRSFVGSVKGMRKSMSSGTGRWSLSSLSTRGSLNKEVSLDRKGEGVFGGLKRWGTMLKGKKVEKPKGEVA